MSTQTSDPQQQQQQEQRLLRILESPPPATCQSETIDFKNQCFVEHEKAFAILIRNLLTPAECDELLHAAEATTAGRWDPALINAGGYNVLAPEVRLCDRIIWDTPAIAGALLERIRPYLPSDIVTLHNRPETTSHDEDWGTGTWQATRLNERLRFLRYMPGMYFRGHTDAHYMTPDGKEVSFLTAHVYLRGSDDLEGGATRFFGEDNHFRRVQFDIDPEPGSCLVFQHHDLYHSGEDVRRGTKYTVRTDMMYRKIAQ